MAAGIGTNWASNVSALAAGEVRCCGPIAFRRKAAVVNIATRLPSSDSFKASAKRSKCSAPIASCAAIVDTSRLVGLTSWLVSAADLAGLDEFRQSSFPL